MATRTYDFGTLNDFDAVNTGNGTVDVTTNPGELTITSTAGVWANNDYTAPNAELKICAKDDFDISIHIVDAPLANNNIVGIGWYYTFNGWVNIQFLDIGGQNKIRGFARFGGNTATSFTDIAGDSVFARITRVGNVFEFFYKLLVGDSWISLGTLNPGTLARPGVLSIYAMDNTGGDITARFDDFSAQSDSIEAVASVPGNPTLDSAVAGNGQVVLTFTAADPGDVIFARNRPLGAGHSGAWAAEGINRTGSGTITVTGLPNFTQQEFSGYTKSGSITSDWTTPLLATPTDGTVAAAAIVEIADEIVTKLNGGTFSTSFTTLRLFVPDFDRSNDLDTLKVSVVPRDIQMEIITREKTKQTVNIDVAIQKAVDNSFSQVDPLLLLVDEIDLFMRFVTLGGASEASWTKTSPNPYYSISHREELFVFTSVLQFTFIFFR